MSLTLPRGWWGYHWSPPHPRSIVELVRARTLDAELAGLLWLLVEGRVPIVVAARLPLAGKSTLLTALLDFLPESARCHVLRGAAEDFDWLPEATALGWSPEAASAAPRPGTLHSTAAGGPTLSADPSTGVILASELSDHLATYTWGAAARVAVRAASLGYGLGTTIHADSLADVIAELSAPPVSLSEDELRALGVVLVMRPHEAYGRAIPVEGIRGELSLLDPDVRRRVVAAHYVRPLERDAGGHVQRRPPAVLATWNADRDEFEHYAWGVAPELAERIGMAPREFDREHAARTSYLERLAADAVVDRDAVSAAIAAYHGARQTGGTASQDRAGETIAAYPQTQPRQPFLADGIAPGPQSLSPEAH